MATLVTTPIKTFVSGETVTPTKLNELSQSAVALTAGTIVAADISADAVTTAKILDANVTTAKLADSAVTTSKINASAVTGPKLADGMVVQVVHASTNATTDISANIPMDDTIPQSTEGSEILTATITPAASTNKVLVSVVVNGTTPSANTVHSAALFKGSASDALTAVRNYGDGYCYQTYIQYMDSPATNSAVTYKIRCGANTGSFYLNQNNANNGMFGGACHSTITLTEIKAS